MSSVFTDPPPMPPKPAPNRVEYKAIPMMRGGAIEYNGRLIETVGECVREMNELRQQLEEAKGVLRFYAESEWDYGCGCCMGEAGSDANPVLDGGKKAADFLERWK